MRRYLALALLIVALLTLLFWAITFFIQPILPPGIGRGFIALAAVLIGVVGVLAGLKDISELLKVTFGHSDKHNDETPGKRYEVIHKLQTKGLEDDLHELINWYYSGVVLYLEVLAERLAHEQYEDAKELMPEILNRARATVNELRILHTSIYSRILEEDQLSGALNSLASVWATRSNLLDRGSSSIIVECPNEINLPMTISEPMLRITTGALTNAIFHSGILEDPNISIRIIVQKSNNQVILRIIDDGIGTDEIIDGYGITRMKSLVSQLNYAGIVSHLEIDTKKGKGTTVTLRIAFAS